MLAHPRNRLPRSRTRNLLAVRREIPDVARGHIALTNQHVHRLEDRRGDVLSVERATGPDLAVVDLGGKRVVVPRLTLSWHYVLMCHEHDRVEGGISTRPTHEQAELVEHGEFAHLEHAGELLAQGGHPGLEGRAIHECRIVARDGGHPQERPESLDRVIPRVVALCCERCTRGRTRTQARCALRTCNCRDTRHRAHCGTCQRHRRAHLAHGSSSYMRRRAAPSDSAPSVFVIRLRNGSTYFRQVEQNTPAPRCRAQCGRCRTL